ncbi:hypothetical protein TrLO_g3214 [Triparma laevis f. longispina]|uniref:Kinesin-like protein n=1 Tax=Triparma laevis f. longispina TaxID=1714387 RepID=A0A9W7EAK9_9STRA|nr:hypothetical protein TrLO_g3214 [Triparma laevis f. longispina]
MDHHVLNDYTGGDSTSSIKVFVRGRPASDPDTAGVYKLFPSNPKKLQIKDPTKDENYGDHIFSYEHVFWSDSTQGEIYESVCAPHVSHVLSGYNSCIFAYGQTGSGKTYSMFGESGENRGLIPRVVEGIVGEIEGKNKSGGECAMVVSFLEIYCDQIRDLGKAYLEQMEGGELGDMGGKTSEIFERMQLTRQSSFNRPRTMSRADSSQGNLSQTDELKNSTSSSAIRDWKTMHHEIHEDLDQNVFVKDLALIPVTTVSEVMAVINQGLELRATHETKINEVSSRSHTVFTINVVQRERGGEAVKGMLNLVDLAGSERIKKSESSGLRLKEALHINTSLTALGKVVLALDPSQNTSHIPYRDSKLTRLLQNSLGGNSYTTLLATIHPIPGYADESLSTLQFANRCRNVQNTPQVNYASKPEKHGGEGGKQMRSEIEVLKKQLAASQSQASLAGDPNLRVLEVLKQLGIACTVQEDGTLMMPDGRVLGSALALGPGAMDNVASATSLGVHGADFDNMMDGASAELQELVADLTQQMKMTKQKLRIKKEDNEKMKNQLAETQGQHQQVVLSMKRSNQQLSHELSQKAQKLEDLQRIMKETHGQQIDELVSHNQKILSQQHAMLNSIPNSLMVNTTLLADARKANEKISLEERVKYGKELKAIEFGRTVEIENIKQQYEFWLNKKQKEAEKFVADFNVYRTKKNATLAEYEAELLKLYSYSTSMRTILRGISEGSYQMKKTRKGYVPVIKEQPVDCLDDHNVLGRTLRLVQKTTEAQQHQKEIRNRANVALMNVADVMGEGGVSALGLGGKGTMNGAPGASLRRTGRPSTAPRSRTNNDIWSAPPQQQFDDDLNTISSHTTRASKASVAFNEDDVDLVTPLEGLPASELKEAVVELREYIGNSLGKAVKNKVMSELSNHDTVNYIKELEDSRDSYQASVRDQAHKLKDLRIAYESLQRRASKAKRGGGGGRPKSGGGNRRPQSAAVSRTEGGGHHNLAF